MNTEQVCRRNAQLALLALLVFPSGSQATESLGPLPAGLVDQVRFKGIRFDVSPLAENANRPAAEWLLHD